MKQKQTENPKKQPGKNNKNKNIIKKIQIKTITYMRKKPIAKQSKVKQSFKKPIF